MGLVASIAGALATSALGSTACMDTRCDGSTATYGLQAGEGSRVDADTWQSTPMAGPWLDFGAERVWTIDLRGSVGPREVVEIVPYVSESKEPNAPGDASVQNFAVGGGNLAVIRIVEPGLFTVRNATCGSYYLRVVAHFAPGGAAVDSDAGADVGAESLGFAAGDGAAAVP
jgi:hypothetical protein